MPERPKPTAPLIVDLTGGDYGLARASYEGLHETQSLKQSYPLLDFDELIAIAASSRASRTHNDPEFLRLLAEGNPCKLIENAKVRGMGWVRKNSVFERVRSAVPLSSAEEKRIQLYAQLNPFKGADFADRITRIGGEIQEKLLQQFRQIPAYFAFECNTKAYREAPVGAEVIKLGKPFPYYPKKGRMPELFANGIRHKLDSFPTEYIVVPPYSGRQDKPLVEPQPPNISEPKGPKPGSGGLGQLFLL